MSQNKIYKAMSVFNDVKAFSKGRIIERLFNKMILKLARKFMK